MGLDLDSEQVRVSTQGPNVLAGASLTEDIEAGVDLAFMYISMPELTPLPPDFYLLRLSGGEDGGMPAVQFINRQGTPVITLPVEGDVNPTPAARTIWIDPIWGTIRVYEDHWPGDLILIRQPYGGWWMV
ncbi:hypothetical protein HPC49_05825 [Pyxidicoccus fallax]|uniref:Uncharacterized protein n=1 Tax=Pyxidicoccus fallax TaxID=394095 RepID=A0A848LGL0_9BACT|nr:hypothetical protein [Pyxidicoccus fallax]NMO15148.1 hypothetical protein [Pyxidicoccus fallax]NPC77770.1 hypothetical protein [Pyxidicoccus fallax]